MTWRIAAVVQTSWLVLVPCTLAAAAMPEVRPSVGLNRQLTVDQVRYCVFTRERLPFEWAMTQNNLGNVLWALGEREEGTERLEEAAGAYSLALEVFTAKSHPANHGLVSRNLGLVLDLLRRGGED